MYWSTNRPNIIGQYAPNHNGKNPWEFLPNAKKAKPNLQLCTRCYKEKSVKPDNLERELFVINAACFCATKSTNDFFMTGFLMFPMRYSERSGFGIIPRPPHGTYNTRFN